MAGLSRQAQTEEDLRYIRDLLEIYKFDIDFVARDLGIKRTSLERRIQRAKERGDWEKISRN